MPDESNESVTEEFVDMLHIIESIILGNIDCHIFIVGGDFKVHLFRAWVHTTSKIVFAPIMIYIALYVTINVRVITQTASMNVVSAFLITFFHLVHYIMNLLKLFQCLMILTICLITSLSV